MQEVLSLQTSMFLWEQGMELTEKEKMMEAPKVRERLKVDKLDAQGKPWNQGALG
jgi:hypothetical protein